MRFNPEIKYNTEHLEALISKGEGVQLDFKQSSPAKKKIARTLVAFANNRGGKLLIGVQDNGQLLGCDTEEEMYMIFEAAEHFCEPPVDIIFSVYETEEHKNILEVEVKNSLRKPHFALDDHDEWQLYMRTNDKTMVASKTTKNMLESEHHTEHKISPLDSKEQYILEFLEKEQEAGSKLIAQKLNISIQRANKMLIKLSQSGLILQHKDERGTYYTLR